MVEKLVNICAFMGETLCYLIHRQSSISPRTTCIKAKEGIFTLDTIMSNNY